MMHEQWYWYGGALFGSFLLAAILTPLVERLALRWQVVDRPNARKIHQRPIPLLGGLAIVGAFLISIGFLAFGGHAIGGRVTTSYIIGLVVASIILMFGGWLDDRYTLQPRQQMISPLLAALTMVIAGLRVTAITNPSAGAFAIPTGLGAGIAFIWLLVSMSTTKFLDGLDGLVSGVTVIGAGIICLVSLVWDNSQSTTTLLALVLAGSVAGFLIFNWHPARIFLGEGGSLWCGFVLGVLSIISGSKIATALLIIGLPLLDIIWVMWQRFRHGVSIMKADRRHLHFRLLDAGLSQRQAVLVIWSVALICGLTSLVLSTSGKIILLLIMTSAALGTVSWLERRSSRI